MADDLFSNAMTATFMADGIPVMYYGQEQGFHGSKDPVSLLTIKDELNFLIHL